MGRLGKTGARFARWRSALGLATAVCATLACSSEQKDEVTLEVYNWWNTSPAESAAFTAVKDAHSQLYPHVRLELVELDSSRRARVEIARRLLLHRPLSTFQANLGADVLDWAVVHTHNADGVESEQTLIHGLRADLPELEGKLHPLLVKDLRVNEQSDFFAVPINIHRLNLVYAHEDAPQELLRTRWCDSAGNLVVSFGNAKIAIGPSFERSLLALENVLLAVAGPDIYERMFVSTAPDDGSWEAPARSALRCLEQLKPHFMVVLNWATAADAVATGQAALTVMGDWAGGHLKAALDDGRVTAGAFPGTEGLFVYTSDTFPLPVDAAHPRDIIALLDFIGSDAAQLLFSDEKGSIPALKDVDVTSLGPRAVDTKLEFESEGVRKVLATSGVLPSYFNMGDLQGDLNLDPDPNALFPVESIMTRLRDAVAATRHWQARRSRFAELPP